MIRFGIMVITIGSDNGNDAASPRSEPVFKMAQGRPPSGRPSASQPTISRRETMADVRALLGMPNVMADLHFSSLERVPKRIMLDIKDMFDAVHGDLSTTSSQRSNAASAELTTIRRSSSGPHSQPAS